VCLPLLLPGAGPRAAAGEGEGTATFILALPKSSKPNSHAEVPSRTHSAREQQPTCGLTATSGRASPTCCLFLDMLLCRVQPQCLQHSGDCFTWQQLGVSLWRSQSEKGSAALERSGCNNGFVSFTEYMQLPQCSRPNGQGRDLLIY
jgi:hypothetical protein